ncbi:MAG: site-specific integrase [Proteobacteria bacterium]|nr:site-specific integrase [Pseudomonadota bacterium]
MLTATCGASADVLAAHRSSGADILAAQHGGIAHGGFGGALPKGLLLHQVAECSLLTGLRRDNVLGLTWNHIDIERQLVWVESEEMKGGQAIAVPLSVRATEILKACRGAHKTHVFTYRGKPVQSVKTGFLHACALAKRKGFTWHGLRHTWATWHVQRKTLLDVLQKLGAWSDLRMVTNYAQHSADYLARLSKNRRTSPAVTSDGMSCARCEVCAVGSRKAIIGFPAHGRDAATAERVISLHGLRDYD